MVAKGDEAPKAGAPADEDIKVTPAMIEAGVSVLCEMDLTRQPEAHWAARLFRAMAAASDSGSGSEGGRQGR